MGKQWKQWEIIFLDSKIPADGDCSHEIKRRLLLGRKAMTNLNNILKSKDITLPTKVCLVKAMVFPIVMCGCESWIIKKAESQRIDAFKLSYWRRPLRLPWTERWSNQSILREISPDAEADTLNTLATWCEELTHLKRPWCWARLKVGGEEDNRRGDGWMASLTWWTWVWHKFLELVMDREAWVLQSMGSQSQTWLSNWTQLSSYIKVTEFLSISLWESNCSWRFVYSSFVSSTYDDDLLYL